MALDGMSFESLMAANTVALARHADLLQQFIDAGNPPDKMPAMRASGTLTAAASPAATSPADEIATTNATPAIKRGPGRPPAKVVAPAPPAAVPTADEMKLAIFRVRDAHGEAMAKEIIRTAGRVEKMGMIPAELRNNVIAACEVALGDAGEEPAAEEEGL